MKYAKAIVPLDDDRFMLVFIWKRKKDFLKANGVEKKSDACYQNCACKDYPLQGEFHFVKGKVDVGMVAHEVVHASKAVARKSGKKRNEEYLCEAVQVITRNVWSAILGNETMGKWVNGKDN